VLQQMGRERMAQDVRRDAGPDPRLPRVPFDQLPEALTRHRSAAAVQEEMGGPLRVERRARLRDVSRDPLPGRAPDRHETLLVPLPQDEDRSRGEIDALGLEPHELRHAKPRRVEGLEHRAVPEPERVRLVGRGEQRLDVLGRERPRQRRPGLRVHDVGRRVRGDDPLPDREGEESAERGDQARGRPRGEPRGAPRLQMAHDLGPADVGERDPPRREPPAELPEIPPVRLDAARREAALDGETIEVRREMAVEEFVRRVRSHAAPVRVQETASVFVGAARRQISRISSSVSTRSLVFAAAKIAETTSGPASSPCSESQ